jgi:hypothetical protein
MKFEIAFLGNSSAVDLPSQEAQSLLKVNGFVWVNPVNPPTWHNYCKGSFDP